MINVIHIVFSVIIFFTGASIFSFLNVVIYRIPHHLSFVSGRSFCPKCGHQLCACDMIPVLSWVFLLGKCRDCKEPISIRYPLMELLGGILAVVCVWYYVRPADEMFTVTFAPVIVFAFLCALTVIAVIDYDTMEIPDGLNTAVLIIGILSCFVFSEIHLSSRIIGIFSVSVPLFLITLAIEGAFGGGDIKLMASCGFFLGWKLNLVALFLAILSGGIYGMYLLAARRKGRKDHFAFGPFLCAGAAASFFMGNRIIDWYLQFLI